MQKIHIYTLIAIAMIIVIFVGMVFLLSVNKQTPELPEFTSGSEKNVDLNSVFYKSMIPKKDSDFESSIETIGISSYDADSDTYNFSIRLQYISNPYPDPNEIVLFIVKVTNEDKENAYTHIPVEISFNGEILLTKYLDFEPGESVTVSYSVNVGAPVGKTKVLDGRVNWYDRHNENYASDNNVSVMINLPENNYALSIDAVEPSDRYAEGVTVISSFMVNNDGATDILPDKNLMAQFIVYYYDNQDGGKKNVLVSQKKSGIVVPNGERNLVYFTWTVPEKLGVTEVICECTINVGPGIEENDRSNNTTSFTATVAALTNFEPADTNFEHSGSYRDTPEPKEYTSKATWSQWSYENGTFILREYGVQLSPDRPVIEPDPRCPSTRYENGRWIMRSGYGITLCYTPSLSAIEGYTFPDQSTCTGIQIVTAVFPEFNYLDKNGCSRRLTETEDGYGFAENNSAGKESLHFTPVAMPDGEYTVSVIVTQIWTPGGMISAVRNADPILLDGSIYDDWYHNSQS